MQLEEIEVEATHDGTVRTVSLPGGELGARAARELSDVAASFGDDRSIRVVVLVSRSGDFCTGPAADLDRIAVSPDPASAFAALRPPIVAACVGQCASVGFELVLAADIRVATPQATFRLDDVRRGQLPCWGGSQRLTRAIRPAAAAGMMLLGDDLTAARAMSLGLVHDVGDVDALTAAITERLLEMGPLAVELAKEAVHRGAELPLRDGLRLEGDLNHLLAATDDRAEGLAAFFAKRPADFAGR